MYHCPSSCYIKQDEPKLPTFYFDSIINPLSAYKVERHKNAVSTQVDLIDDDELENFTVTDSFGPLLADEELCNRKTSKEIALLWAPKPFNQRTGKTRRV